MHFFEFFEILKDLLTGLTRMHLAHLVHRDLKPANILIMNKKYYLVDYGEGLNLYYDNKK